MTGSWAQDTANLNLEWRLGSESNRRTRSCSPLHDHSATQPVLPNLPARQVTSGLANADPVGIALCMACGRKFGAGNETRTRDPDLGKVVLYQLSYSRIFKLLATACLAIFFLRQAASIGLKTVI